MYNQDLHVIVGTQFFFQFPFCLINVKLQDQFWKVSFAKRVSWTPLVNRIEEFNGVYAQHSKRVPLIIRTTLID